VEAAAAGRRSAAGSPASLHVHDLVEEHSPGTLAIRWQSESEYTPVLRFGIDVPDRHVPVDHDPDGYRAVISGLVPGGSYVYRIGGWPGGPAEPCRFAAQAPGAGSPHRVRSHFLGLAAGLAVREPNFGDRRPARSLWIREAATLRSGTVADGRCYLLDATHIVAADLDLGHDLWAHPMSGQPGPGREMPRPVAIGSLVVVADARGPLGLDAASGQPRWRDPIAGVRWLGSAGGEVYAYAHEGAGRLYRIQATDGRIVSVIGVGRLARRVAVDLDHALFYWDRTSRDEEARSMGPGGEGVGEGAGAPAPGVRPPPPQFPGAGLGEAPDATGGLVVGRLRWDISGDSLLKVTDRLRGAGGWEKPFARDQAPVLPPVLAGGRVLLAFPDRLVALAARDGRELAQRAVAAAPTALLAGGGGSILLATGGDAPAVEVLSPALAVRRSFKLPSPVRRGAWSGDLVALADPDGLTLLDLSTGQWWAISGVTRATALELSGAGHLVAFTRRTLGDPATPDGRVLALGLR
jgi:hypothetical protein